MTGDCKGVEQPNASGQHVLSAPYQRKLRAIWLQCSACHGRCYVTSHVTQSTHWVSRRATDAKLMQNMGDVTHRSLKDWDETAWDRLMAINLKGPFFLIQSLLPLFVDPSSVILCGSTSAHIGLPQSSAYAASKAGLLSLARTLSSELVSRGIRINVLSPGPTETPALGKLGLPPQQLGAMQEQIRKLVPIGRMGTPWEPAMAAVFLAGDESRFVVGTELLVDGGVANL